MNNLRVKKKNRREKFDSQQVFIYSYDIDWPSFPRGTRKQQLVKLLTGGNRKGSASSKTAWSHPAVSVPMIVSASVVKNRNLFYYKQIRISYIKLK